MSLLTQNLEIHEEPVLETSVLHAEQQALYPTNISRLASQSENLRSTGRRKNHGAVHVSAVDRQEP